MEMNGGGDWVGGEEGGEVIGAEFWIVKGSDEDGAAQIHI